MKTILFPYLLLYSIFITSSNIMDEGFIIRGYLTGVKDSTKIMLQNVSNGKFMDSVIVMDSQFIFKGKLIDEPEELRIVTSREDNLKGNFFYTDLLIGNENVEISGDISDLPYNVNTSGSDTQEVVEKYRKKFYQFKTNIDSLLSHKKLLNKKDDSIKMINLDEIIKNKKNDFELWKVTYLEENFNSYFALLTYNYRQDFSTEKLKTLFKGVSGELKQSKYGKAIQTQIDFPKPIKGDFFYDDIEINNLNGEKMKLSDLEDKHILIQFAGVGCYGSRLSVENMNSSIYDTFKDSVTFISMFFVESDKSICKKYLEEYNIPWQSNWISGGKYGEINKYSITGTPTFYLLSPEKRVISTWYGHTEGKIETELSNILK